MDCIIGGDLQSKDKKLKDRFLSVRSKQNQQLSGMPQDYQPREECHRHKKSDLRRYMAQLSMVEPVE